MVKIFNIDRVVLFESAESTTVADAVNEAIKAGANLSGAEGISKYMTSPLYMLLDQPGKIRAYKLVTKDGTGPTYTVIQYAMGKTIAIVVQLWHQHSHAGLGNARMAQRNENTRG